MNNLILVRGVSGAGKSTIAPMFENAKLVSTDDFFLDEYETSSCTTGCSVSIKTPSGI